MAEFKLPPQNLEAEKSVLGSILIDEEAMFKIAESLTAGNFYEHKHQLIYEAMLYLYSHQQAIDVLTLSTKLKADKNLKNCGGMSYLTELVETVPTSAHIEEYANMITEQSQRRRLISLASEIDELAYKENQDLPLVLDEVEKNLMGIAQSTTGDDFVHISSLLEESI